MKIHRATHGNRQCLALSLCSIHQGVPLINFKITHVFMDGFLSSQKAFALNALLGSCSFSLASANAWK